MLKDFKARVCLIGLGYVGLPLAVEFAKKEVEVVGFDVNESKITKLKNGVDPCEQIDQEVLNKLNIPFSTDPKIIGEYNFIIVAVPTPINESKEPDLTYLEKASKTVGENLSKDSIVVFESTVYPGATEDFCLPIIEKYSKLKCGQDFHIGYSPERVNPGDQEHTIEKIVKVVSGMNKESTQVIADTYSIVISAGVFKAKNIKTAEAAKVIENIQRDLNIALVNELALIFDLIGIKTTDVIEAASTKWNFHKYHPGLVGGHCIGVDPYYLVFKAQQLGYDPKVLLAGRAVNEKISNFVVEKVKKMLEEKGKKMSGARILIMGLTFKENVNDTRNSKASDIIKHLHEEGATIVGFDPNINNDEFQKTFEIETANWNEIKNLDAIIIFNKHDAFKNISPEELKEKYKDEAVIFDIKELFKKEELEKLNFTYASL